jgi:hypothetical protein
MNRVTAWAVALSMVMGYTIGLATLGHFSIFAIIGILFCLWRLGVAEKEREDV